MQIKAKDIAAQLDISPATVSLVIHNKPGVSEETRKKVHNKIAELNCTHLLQPNVPAQPAEQAGSAASIAFVLYKKGGELMVDTPFFPYMIAGLENAVRFYHCALAIINLSADDPIDKKIADLKKTNCIGYVVFATEMQMNDSDIQLFRSLGIPFTILDNYFPNEKIDCVALNNEQGVHALINHLLELGHKKIGYLSSGLQISSFAERKEYCFQYLYQLGMVGMEKYCYEIGYSSLNACNGMKSILTTQSDLPTAFLADNDIVAIGAMSAMKDFGIRVPEDISVVGFDDRPDCLSCNPPLTTIHIPTANFGAEPVALLIEQINRKRDSALPFCPRKLELGVELVVRKSSGPI